MEILESALEATIGLRLVFAIAALLLLEESSEIAAAIRVFVVVWALYRVSSLLDNLFDLAYEPGPRPGTDATQNVANNKPQGLWSKWRRFWLKCRLSPQWWSLRRTSLPGYEELEKERDAAANELRRNGSDLRGVTGVYAASKKMLERQDKERGEIVGKWEAKVKPAMALSKAARAFIVPSLLAFIAVGAQALLPQCVPAFPSRFGNLPLVAAFRADFMRAQEKLEFFRYPAVPAVVLLGTVFLYIALRLRSMKNLYALVVPKRPENS